MPSTKKTDIKTTKCIFDQQTVEYHGYSFLNEGMRPTPLKIKTLKEANWSCDAKGVKRFLGLANYLEWFIDDYSTITYPLRFLLTLNEMKNVKQLFKLLKHFYQSHCVLVTMMKPNLLLCTVMQIQ